ncbi:tetratricopeptide repeat protein 1-like [Panonychus citri]|uniref:tetratricopeptide repeat protein 1-like n=1 Tax=Panonychus citri TaxID=50023 RepID=UPI00230820F9|nr:tetratricopeptide repeat protein 1-like [Panonychus citri]
MENLPGSSEELENNDSNGEPELQQLSAEEIEEMKIKCDQLKQQGNTKFKDNQLDEAIDLYSQAINLCPLTNILERSVLFNNRAAAYFHKHGEESSQSDGDDNNKGRNNLTEVEEEEEEDDKDDEDNLETKEKTESWLDKCVADCSSSIDLNEKYIKPYLKRAQAYRKMGKDKLDLSLEDYEMVIKIDPTIKECYPAINQLKEEIDKRNEQMKNEMIGKLKDIGNVVLNKFGLSTDNFQMVKNPDTGSYSINFKS